MADTTYSISLTAEQLDLLDDVLEYYAASDFGGGDHADEASKKDFRAITRRVDSARVRAGRDVWPINDARTAKATPRGQRGGAR